MRIGAPARFVRRVERRQRFEPLRCQRARIKLRLAAGCGKAAIGKGQLNPAARSAADCRRMLLFASSSWRVMPMHRRRIQRLVDQVVDAVVEAGLREPHALRQLAKEPDVRSGLSQRRDGLL